MRRSDVIFALEQILMILELKVSQLKLEPQTSHFYAAVKIKRVAKQTSKEGLRREFVFGSANARSVPPNLNHCLSTIST